MNEDFTVGFNESRVLLESCIVVKVFNKFFFWMIVLLVF